MIAFNGQYLPAASHGNMRITAACLGGQLVLGNWLMTATAQAIIAAFGREEGIAVIIRTNDYLNALALTDQTRAQQLAMFINEDPLNGVGIGQFFTNAELQAVADAQLIAEKKLDDGSCWVRILHHDTNGGVRIFKSVTEAEYNPVEDMYSVLKYIGKWQYDGKYEFLAEEYMTQGATTHTDHRWSQTSNPYETIRATGFVNISNTKYGIGNFYIEHGKSTLLSYRNPSNLANWFAAVGCMVIWQSGIPPFDDKAQVANKGTLDLWIRIS